MVATKELLSSALPGRAPRQAPRNTVALLATLEELAVDTSSPVSLKCSVGGCYCSRGDAQIRGPSRCDAVRREDCGSSFTAKLTRSKTTPHWDHNSRMVVVDSSSTVQEHSWLVAGLHLFSKVASYRRYHLLPLPTNGVHCPIADHFTPLLFNFRIAHHWTLHSRRISCPVRRQHSSVQSRIATCLEDGLPKAVSVTAELRSHASGARFQRRSN